MYFTPGWEVLIKRGICMVKNSKLVLITVIVLTIIKNDFKSILFGIIISSMLFTCILILIGVIK